MNHEGHEGHEGRRKKEEGRRKKEEGMTIIWLDQKLFSNYKVADSTNKHRLHYR